MTKLKPLKIGKWFAIMAIMNIIIDKFGRLVLPKNVRDHFGLVAGSALSLEEKDDRIVLKVINEEEPPLVMEDGLLVFAGQLTGSIDATLTAIREERLQHFY